jgi:21S rRNA (GM2251-2'-O)-methyltransferase
VQERKESGGGGAGPARKAAHETAVESILRLAAALEVPVKRAPKGDLNVLSGNRPHQGYVLHCSQLDYEDCVDVGRAPEVADGAVAPVWLVLDEVTDPQNLGALVRSAHFLGAAGVVACRRNSAALTPAVSKASAGAVEGMAVRGVASMPRFLRRARELGWRVVGAALADDAVALGTLQPGAPTLVVLGSEGRGLRPMVREACDVLVQIGGRAVEPGSGVDSLNVSVAGAIVLHQLLGA